MSALTGVPLWEYQWKWMILRDPFGPMPMFFGDYLNSLTLPFDWDPQYHMQADGQWVELNTSGFWIAMEIGDRLLPVAPRLDEDPTLLAMGSWGRWKVTA